MPGTSQQTKPSVVRTRGERRSVRCLGNVTWCGLCEKQLEAPPKPKHTATVGPSSATPGCVPKRTTPQGHAVTAAQLTIARKWTEPTVRDVDNKHRRVDNKQRGPSCSGWCSAAARNGGRSTPPCSRTSETSPQVRAARCERPHHKGLHLRECPEQAPPQRREAA